MGAGSGQVVTASFQTALHFPLTRADTNGSMNECLTVVDDGYSLFLKPMGFQLLGRSVDKELTNQGAAEYYWSLFIEPLQ
jgi:hypothetical protein